MSDQKNAELIINELLARLREPAVADLAWSVFATPLIHRLENHPNILIPNFPLTKSRIDWLQALDAHPAPLLKHLEQPKTKRLGQYFEALWEYFLLADSDTEMLAKNLQVQDQGKTLGEFDFIYRDKHSGQVVHLELAVKLYLGFPMTAINTASPMDWWQGPNCIDRLDLKINKLFNKQLALGNTEPAHRTLQGLEIDSVNPALFFAGYLFYPHDTKLTPPSLITPAHQHGRWWYLRDIRNNFDKTAHYSILAKSEWLCRHHHQAVPKLNSLDELYTRLADYFQRWGRPSLVCIVRKSNYGWQEQERFFVVPDNWPVVLFEHR